MVLQNQDQNQAVSRSGQVRSGQVMVLQSQSVIRSLCRRSFY